MRPRKGCVELYDDVFTAVGLLGRAGPQFGTQFISLRATCVCKRPRGIVQPYADSPMDQELTGHSAYLRIIQSAQDYVYIATPYLIIDDILMRALP